LGNTGCRVGGFGCLAELSIIGLIKIYLSITLSPVSVAAKGLASSTRGLSLRFPRFLRVREDKATEQASPPEFLADIWKKQQGSKDGIIEDELVDVDFASSPGVSEDDLSEMVA